MINGELIDLRAGDYAARIATAGATLVHLRRSDRDLVLPFDAASELPSGWQGKTLAPWPNRTVGAAYAYGGTGYLLPRNEPETDSALHGLVGWLDWQVVDAAEDSVALEVLLPASYAYPWSLELSSRWELDAEVGLTMTLTATCVGAARPSTAVVGAPLADGALLPAPYGAAFHPYLLRGAGADDCTLTVPAAAVLTADERMVPSGLVDVAGTDWDFRSGSPMTGVSVDNAFTDLPEGTWQVRVEGEEGAVVLASDAPWAQVYTDDGLGRRAIAVEPMTCPPNALNSGDGLLTLAVGQSHTLACSLREEH
ncbi:aldose 1-epimerase [Actinomyces denticolens]|uniref:Aldose 1-epimerase n=1 Tax=Actinomyces denticolens TaxID=52767 RepID=A0ABY1I2R2_9ACTO|nr:aldose epimerase [Actinomyces denticolens]SHI48512.1 aldose 1-epimerase [Actinomyces denticolens]